MSEQQQNSHILYVIGSRNSLDDYITLHNIGSDEDSSGFHDYTQRIFEPELHPNLFFVITPLEI